MQRARMLLFEFFQQFRRQNNCSLVIDGWITSIAGKGDHSRSSTLSRWSSDSCSETRGCVRRLTQLASVQPPTPSQYLLPVIVFLPGTLIDGMLFGAVSAVLRFPPLDDPTRAPLEFRQRLHANQWRFEMRPILSKGLLILAMTTVAALGADNSIGTWKLNLEKSTYTGAPMPVKSLTVTREASEGGVKQTTTGEQANGTAINASYTAKYDGKEVQVTGNAPYDTIAVKQVNANTLTDARKKTGGKYHGTSRLVVSNGGKTMTTTTKGTNADGEGFTSVFVFDKQ